ncbi:hypothetical protein [Algoriphagus machipongonensis]|uniref:Lipocalin-like domain-containing protein n=1 Tax=Algoriphagus machipongonensis TaxID=388413 RepID=A3HX43_9BACT|nr:hypothetical protein [Algoriphagus machipongonensis]EAZ81166.1 hypothetical protein ALPR1_19058 [Algoriphagus machipongonensis]
MKRHTLLLGILIFSSIFTLQAQSLQENLLGKWKLTRDEGFEYVANSPEFMAGPQEEKDKFFDWMEEVHSKSYKNFYSLDSMTSTIVDRKEIIQEKSVWNVRKTDSVITWKIRFAPKVIQAKVIKITDQELILGYLNQDQTLGRFKTFYKKEETN